MRRSVFAAIAAVSTIAVAQTAFAADLAVKARPFAPAVYNWTGFYVGGHAGYSWMDSTDTVSPADAVTARGWLFPGEIGSPGINPAGFIGGGQIGYNWQVAPTWVFGAEADISWTDLNKTVSVAGTVDPSRVITGQEKLNWLGTVRGRLGYLPAERVMLYATGGLAYGDARLSTALSRTTGSRCAGNNCQSGSTSDTLVGWTVGGGLEWAFANNWSAKAEYLYFDLGSLSHAMTDPNFPLTNFNASAPFKGSIARVGLNYQFH